MAQKGYGRKLSTVSSADAESYSLLMGRNEETTVRTFTEYRGVISEVVTKYQGRVVNSPGDNILAVANPIPLVDPVIRIVFCIIFPPIFTEIWQYDIG